MGKLKVMKDGKVIAEKDVVALTGVEEGSWLRRMWDAIVLWFKRFIQLILFTITT